MGAFQPAKAIYKNLANLGPQINKGHFMLKNLVIYHYYEKDDSYRDNFLHFLTFGYSTEIDYVVVVAGGYSIDLPLAENITYVFTENLNNDFGGYCHAINNIIDVNKYEFFFFINSSVRGPFLATREKKLWTEYFIEQLDSDVGIVGSTINILSSNSYCSARYSEAYGAAINYSHVQTTSYLLPKKSLLHLIDQGFYNSSGILDKEDAIRDYELKLSQLIKRQGWNLKSLLPEYNKIDYRLPHGDINPTSENGDTCFKDAYFGRTIHPNEIIFIKTNREIYPLNYFDRLAYSLYVSGQATGQALQDRYVSSYLDKLRVVTSSKVRISYVPLLKTYKALIKKTVYRIKGKDFKD